MHKGKNLPIQINRRKTGKRIATYILSRGYTSTSFAASIGLAEEKSVYRWCTGKVIPSSEYLIAMAVVHDLDIRAIIDYTDLR